MSNYLITGASSDIVKAFVNKHVWQSQDNIIAQFNSHEPDYMPENTNLIQADFSQDISTKNFIEKIQALNFVPEYVLHAPAGKIFNMRFNELTWENFQTQINIQVRSFMKIISCVIKNMARQKFGRVVVILSSCVLNVPPKFLADYVTAKYALTGLIKSLASEYAHKNIYFNMISPSMVQTKFLNNIYEGVIQNSAKNNPSGRNVNVNDLAGVIEFLLSGADFITGSNIPVTGGEIF